MLSKKLLCLTQQFFLWGWELFCENFQKIFHFLHAFSLNPQAVEGEIDMAAFFQPVWTDGADTVLRQGFRLSHNGDSQFLFHQAGNGILTVGEVGNGRCQPFSLKESGNLAVQG